MTTSPTRRRRIIQDQKYPSDFIVPRYTEAQETIAGFVRRGATDDSIKHEFVGRLAGIDQRTETRDTNHKLTPGFCTAVLSRNARSTAMTRAIASDKRCTFRPSDRARC